MTGVSGTRSSYSAPWLAAVAVLFLLMLIALVLRFLASKREYDYFGPTHIAASESAVFVYASGELMQLSPSGRLLQTVALERTGLDEDPIDLRVLGSGELLVAGQQPASVRVCKPSDWVCRPLAQGALRRIDRQFKLLPVPGGTDWLLTDARGDALWRLDGAGEDLVEALPPRTLAGPNGLAWDHSGHVWVADTDNRRILELIPTGGGGLVPGREHSAVNDLTIGERYYPMMMEWGADGRAWVVQAAEFSQPLADLVVYGPDAGAEAVVALPPGAYPTDLAVLSESLLVSDLERFVVYRVDTASRGVAEFGDEAFRAKLGAYHEQRARYGRLGAFALVGLVLFAVLLVLAAIRATPKDRRWSATAGPLEPDRAAENVPPLRGAHWLEKNPKLRWMSTWFERTYYAMFGLFCLVSIVLYAWSCSRPADPGEAGLSASAQLGLTLLLACLAIASFIPFIHLAASAFRRRIGTDGKRVLFELEDGRRLSVEPGDLGYNRRAVVYRRYTFPVQAGNRGSVYAEGEVDTWLAPLLRQSRRLSEWQLTKHQWAFRDRLLLALTGASLAMGLVVLLLKLLVGGS